MKKYLLIFIACSTLWSCMTDEQYEDLNRDPKNPTIVEADYLFTNAIVSLSDVLASPSVNINIFRFIAQYFTSTTYLDEPNYDLTQRAIPQNFWSEIFRDVIFDVRDAKAIVEASVELSQGEKDARLAQLEVIEVYAWQVLVDTFGDIPYSQALQAQKFPLPAYDDAATIYEDLIARIMVAQDQIDAGQGFVDADVLYKGDMAKWDKFASSLLLRLGMRLSEVNPSLAKEAATAAMEDGVFMSNSDTAQLIYTSTTPNTNPLWEDLVQSGRSDFVVANTVVDYLNALEDPRRSAYFDDNLDGIYVGGVYGGSNSFPTVSHVGEMFHDPTLPGILLDYAEVEFHLAEAAERNFIEGSAEDHYNTAIAASILYWGGTSAEVIEYLGQPEVAYSSDNWETQLGLQFWIAMYNNPFQGWTVWRKFDDPQLNRPADTGLPVPLRYTYPVNEQNLNEVNYLAASEAIGGDEQQTSIFWDIQ